jgi:serine/threonine-protein kinase
MTCPSIDDLNNIPTDSASNIGLNRRLLKEGDRLAERFIIEKQLGSGSFGAVYLARDEHLRNRPIAIKVVLMQSHMGNLAASQLENEFLHRDKITDYKHVLKVQLPIMTTFNGHELLLLPLEFADGGCMRKWLVENKDVRQRENLALEYFLQACEGVKAIHAADLAHLDLKPENLLLLNGMIKVADFGLSRDVLQLSGLSPELMRDGVGTPLYMAPEQVLAARPEDIDHRADIYSLGVILFELLDGKPPYAGTNRQILEKIERGIRPKPRGVAEHYVGVINRCLERDPELRYQTVADLLKALSKEKTIESPAIVKTSSGEDVKPGVTSDVSSGSVDTDKGKEAEAFSSRIKPTTTEGKNAPDKNRWSLIAGAIVLVAVIAGFIFYRNEKPKHDEPASPVAETSPAQPSLTNEIPKVQKTKPSRVTEPLPKKAKVRVTTPVVGDTERAPVVKTYPAPASDKPKNVLADVNACLARKGYPKLDDIQQVKLVADRGFYLSSGTGRPNKWDSTSVQREDSAIRKAGIFAKANLAKRNKDAIASDKAIIDNDERLNLDAKSEAIIENSELVCSSYDDIGQIAQVVMKVPRK